MQSKFMKISNLGVAYCILLHLKELERMNWENDFKKYLWNLNYKNLHDPKNLHQSSKKARIIDQTKFSFPLHVFWSLSSLE